MTHGTPSPNDRIRGFYDGAAGGYDGWMRLYEAVLLGDRRRRLCARARGRTLEIAVGTGLNLPHYPHGIALVGVDLSAGMLARARERARSLGIDVELRLGDAQALDAAPDSFDTVVATLVFSTIPEPARLAAECRRVLRPGGQLLVLDHVRSRRRWVRALEQALDPLASRLAAVRLVRQPLDDIRAAGLTIAHQERSRAGIIEEIVATKDGGA